MNIWMYTCIILRIIWAVSLIPILQVEFNAPPEASESPNKNSYSLEIQTPPDRIGFFGVPIPSEKNRNVGVIPFK